MRVPAALAVTLAAIAVPIAGLVSFGCHDGPGPEKDALLRGMDAHGGDGGLEDAPRDALHDAPEDAGSGAPLDAMPDAP